MLFWEQEGRNLYYQAICTLSVRCCPHDRLWQVIRNIILEGFIVFNQFLLKWQSALMPFSKCKLRLNCYAKSKTIWSQLCCIRSLECCLINSNQNTLDPCKIYPTWINNNSRCPKQCCCQQIQLKWKEILKEKYRFTFVD